MRVLALLGLASLAIAQTESTPSTTTLARRQAASAISVAQDGSGQYTAINAAISAAQSSGIPTVTIAAGTYTETISILATAAVTVVAAAPSPSDYSQNQVVITNTNATVMQIATNNGLGITWKNINFVLSGYSPGATTKLYPVSLRGKNNQFLGCQFVTGGPTAFYSTLGASFIANSYFEADSKTISGYLDMYIYNSTVTATALTNAILLYQQGYGASGGNSTVVFDTCTLDNKPGNKATGVYLTAVNGDYSQAIWRNTYMGAMIASAGLHSSVSLTTYPHMFFGEFQTTGNGSYSVVGASKRSTVERLLTPSDLAPFTVANVFANAFSGYATTDLSFLDQNILSAIQSSDAAQVAAYQATALPSTSSIVSSTTSSLSSSTNSTSSTTSSVGLTTSSVTTTSSTTSSSASVTSTLSTISNVTTTSTDGISSSVASTTSMATTSTSSSLTTSSTVVASSTVSTNSNSTTSTTSTLAATSATTSSTCTLPSDVPSTAYVVGTSGSCAAYNSLQAAISALPADSTTQYIYILAGTYTALTQTNISRSGATIFRGESSSRLDQTQNQVVLSYSGGASVNSGPETVALFRSTQGSSKGLTFYNINFVNTYPATSNYAAIAVDAKSPNVAFYSCGFDSTQSTILTNSGSFYFSGCRISGTTDILWAWGTTLIENSIIVSTSTQTGLSISAQNYVATYALGSQLVFRDCSFIPGSSAVPKGYTFLGRDYSTSARVAVISSFLDAHISAAGWQEKTLPSNTTFVEYNNTGTGAARSNAPTNVQLLTSAPSGYAASDLFTSTAFIDQDAVVPFAGYASSPYSNTNTTSSVSTTSATATSSSASSTVSSAAAATITVGANATYTNVTAAISSLPNDGTAYTIYILAGVYEEQVSITRAGKVTLIGQTDFANDYSQNQVTIQFNYGVSTSAGEDEDTPVIKVTKQNSDLTGVALYNINFINTATQTKNFAALASDFYAYNVAAYGCLFKGYQDTLLANKGTQVFSNSYIEGSVDYIWGYSKAYFHGCQIVTNTAGACISAQSRTAGTVSGYVFDSCTVTYSSTYGSSYGLSYLGRPYNNYSTAVYMNSYIDKHINSAGWQVWQTSNPQTSNVTFAEYNNEGPGSWQASTQRASFATNLTSDEAATYTLSNWIGDTSWLDMTTFNLVPSYNVSVASTTTSANATSTSTVGGTSTINAHPDSGTIAPAGSVVVDITGANGNFTNITAALASLPSDSSNQTIFIFPGSYNEQLPAINRPGPVRIIGYTTAAPGASYEDNTVTLTFARGLSVSPLPTGHSDAETATFTTTSNTIAIYNINIYNTDNSDGAEASYVTLAGSIYGSHIGFYAVSMTGWQDTLLTGATNGYHYYENSYIEGAIDFVWGYSASYFKGCTIAGKKAKSCMTAQSRASSGAIGGYFFDECLFTQASSITTDLSGTMYLGRPYSAYAKVMIKYSYLDEIINPSGWKIWSTTDPRTDYITFVEYENQGPGNWENNTAARLAFQNATLATSEPFTLASVMDSTSWIDMTYFSSVTTPQPAVVITTTPVAQNTTVAGNSTFDGTTAPAGSYIVSQNAITGVTTYDTIQGAINAAPTDSKTNVTIFIYPGTYNEQIVVNKSGSMIFRGYSESTGDYTQNQVTIQNDRGIDTAADESNSDGATVYATGNYFYAYNINFQNIATEYATLGFAVKSSKYASLYACQVLGGQDSLEINGFFFAFKSYVAGAVDFVWGSGAGYFLNSTLAPNADDINITADKRATVDTAAGFVFDQCTIQTPADYTDIGLGRPWNNMSRVAYIDTYMPSSIIPAGWNQWSKSAPQTELVEYSEYNNYGPGSDIGCRANFSQQLTDETVVPYQLGNFFAATNWINFTVIDVQPFIPGIGSPPSSTGCQSASTVSSSTMSSTTSLLNSTIGITATTTVFKTTTLKISASTTITPDPVDTVVVVTQTTTAISTIQSDVVTSISTLKQGTTVFTTISQPDVTSISTIKSTDSEISTIVPIAVTKYTTQTITTQVAGSIVTKTSVATSIVTITPDPVTKTSVAKATTTVQGSAVFVVQDQTTTVTVTGDPATKTITSTSLLTEVDTTLVDGPTSTLQTTQTQTSTVIASAKAASVVVYTTSTKVITKTVSTKATTISAVSQTTVTASDSTTTLKAATSVSSVTVSKTTTKKTTSTLTCIPTAAVQKRNDHHAHSPNDRRWFEAAPAGPRLVGRAAGISTETDYTTLTSIVKTVTATASGISNDGTTTSVLTISKTTTAKPSTVVVTYTSLSAKSSTVTQAGNTIFTTTTALAEVDSTTTLKASTTTSTIVATVSALSGASTTIVPATVISTSTLKRGTTSITSTSVHTSSLPETQTTTETSTITSTVNGGTTTSTFIVTATTTSVLTQTGAVTFVTSTKTAATTTTQIAAGNVSTKTSTVVVSTTSTITLPQSTITKMSVQTVKAAGNVATVTPAAVVSTKTVTGTMTVVSVVSKTSKGAVACSAS